MNVFEFLFVWNKPLQEEKNYNKKNIKINYLSICVLELYSMTNCRKRSHNKYFNYHHDVCRDLEELPLDMIMAGTSLHSFRCLHESSFQNV